MEVSDAAFPVGVMLSVDVKVLVDMWPFWLHEAIDAALTAEQRTTELRAAWESGQEGGLLIKRELEASMRAVVALACAFEAFHSLILVSSGADEPTGRRKGERILGLLRDQLITGSSHGDRLHGVVARVFTLRNRAVHFESVPRPLGFRSDRPGVGFDPYHKWFTGMEAGRLARSAVEVFDQLVASMPSAPSQGVRDAADRTAGRLLHDVTETTEARRLAGTTRLAPRGRPKSPPAG